MPNERKTEQIVRSHFEKSNECIEIEKNYIKSLPYSNLI